MWYEILFNWQLIIRDKWVCKVISIVIKYNEVIVYGHGCQRSLVSMCISLSFNPIYRDLFHLIRRFNVFPGKHSAYCPCCESHRQLYVSSAKIKKRKIEVRNHWQFYSVKQMKTWRTLIKRILKKKLFCACSTM